MDETDGTRGGAAGGMGAGRWGWTPPLAWVGLTMLLAVRGLYSMVPLALESSLPPPVTAYLQAGIGVAMVNLLWGAWILAAARSRSRALRRGFLTWQAFNLVALTATVGYTAFAADFVTTASGLLIPAVEFAVGIALIVYVLRLANAPAPAADAAPLPLAGTPPTVALTLVNGVIGGVVGAILGGIAGFPFGVLLAEMLDVSCFEGACGYFAGAIGLLLVVAGFVTGVVVAVLRTRRAARRRAA